MSELQVHGLAKCSWCGAAFVRGLLKVLNATPWVCPNTACWQRQTAHAMIVHLKGKERNCRFVPLPRQVDAIDALKSSAIYILLGGAAGGSKSKILREIAYQECLRVSNFKVLLLRRTYKELDQTHLRDAEMEAPEMGAVAVPSAKLVRFPNGSVVQFGHCETTADAANYLSAEYDLILFDELVTFEELQFLMISSRARSNKPGVVPKVMAGTNPGGPQSHWVKSRFIDHNVDLDIYPDYRHEEWAFIPSKLDDNPYLDASYERKLLNLPPEMRKAYRDGDWDIFPGQFFPEWRKGTHVAELQVPPGARWYRAIDWGFVKPGACLWVAVFPEGRAYVRHEWLPQRVVNSEQAKTIAAKTQEYGIKVLQSVADTGMWTPDGDSGESPAETYQRYGVPLTQASKERPAGWARLREWLRTAPDGKPWLMVHPDCAYLIRTLPSLVSDDRKPEDVDTDGEDHAADALRYFVMGRPSPGRTASAPEVKANTLGWFKRLSAQEPMGILARRSA
jgi:hypothetical protein